MRHIFTIFFLLFFVSAFAQAPFDSIILKRTGDALAVSPGQSVVIRCTSNTATGGSSPLYVIDGIPVTDSLFHLIDPEDIESVGILKERSAISFYSSRAPADVILITTKSAGRSAFPVRDVLNGAGVSGATVRFISIEKKDTLTVVADDNGMVIADRLIAGKEYAVQVSSAGYKTLSAVIKIAGRSADRQPFLMERDIVEMGNVVVKGRGHTRVCCRGYCCTQYGTSIRDSLQSAPAGMLSSFTVFPNPVIKGSAVTITVKTEVGGMLGIRVLNVSGQPLLLQRQSLVKGDNFVRVKTGEHWTPGVYIVQLVDEACREVKSERLIIR